MENVFDGPAGALAQPISNLRLLQLLAQTHQQLPFATLRLELQSIEQRLSCINVKWLDASEASNLRKLDRVIEVLGQVRHNETRPHHPCQKWELTPTMKPVLTSDASSEKRTS